MTHKYSWLYKPLIALVYLIAIIFLVIYKNRLPDNIPPAVSSNEARRVFVLGIDSLSPGINPDQQNLIEHRLYSNASIKGNNLYTGAVRPESHYYKPLYTPSGNVHTQYFEVDIEPSKTTYTVLLRELQGAPSVSILCAPQEKQLDTSAKCEESLWP